MLHDLYQEYIGRLLISYPGPRVQGRAFYLEKHYGNLIVAQLFEDTFQGEPFCGYDKVAHEFSRIEVIIKLNNLYWKAALEKVKGVYLINDKNNGKMYVGSAYGDSGFWSRWACYIGTVHGYNDELTDLIEKKESNMRGATFDSQFSSSGQ